MHYVVVDAQLDSIFKDLPKEYFCNLVIAYEPIWAIGTGKVATPEQVNSCVTCTSGHQALTIYAKAQDMHSHIRKWLSLSITGESAESMHVLYGGSVSPSNYEKLKSLPDVDGFLVGGACLKSDFSKLCR